MTGIIKRINHQLIFQLHLGADHHRNLHSGGVKNAKRAIFIPLSHLLFSRIEVLLSPF